MADNSMQVEEKGLQELIARMHAFPNKLKAVEKVGMDASLMVLWENVPSYPPPPPDSTYRRTGTLGRMLGSSEVGGSTGGSKPSIYQVKGLGSNNVEGRFGSSGPDYNEYVVGENQARHMGHWWKLSSILPKAEDKIIKVWQGIAQKLADFLNARSSGVE